VKEQPISVTEASRNFADCVNRAHYQGMAFTLLKNGVSMARIVPVERNATTGRELAAALRDASRDFHLGEDEATAWLHDLEQARRTLPRPGAKWQS
jgi:antitoxin (DNA-binding transcriptional repressor) of toxin-antitoxin stability system